MVSNTYDALGLRISRTAGGQTRSYVLNYAADLPSIAVVRAGAADLRYYVWLPSGPLLYSLEAADNSRHFYHFDESGSANFLTGDAGAVTDTYAITPYGETVVHTGAADNPFTFQGATGVMQEDSAGLFYMRARYYDGASARFLSRDPQPSLHPLAMNPYQFALENPIEGGDPSGLDSGKTVAVQFLDAFKNTVFGLPATATTTAIPAPYPGVPLSGSLPPVRSNSALATPQPFANMMPNAH
jgi:RHS repeat-associated protein